MDWFDTMAARNELPPGATSALLDCGFVVLRDVVPRECATALTDAYDTALSTATGSDLKVGSTTTRVSDLVNRGADFDELYILPVLLDACCRVIGGPFKLSSLVARTLRPRTPAQELHVDVRRTSMDWPLLGFLFMVDGFRPENGATRFVPGSQHWLHAPEDTLSDPRADHEAQELACGPTASLVVFHGSTWHGHTANTSDQPRRSVQGAFIPRNGQAATDFARRMSPETHSRLSPLARYVLAV
jgi:hypothetical protein